LFRYHQGAGEQEQGEDGYASSRRVSHCYLVGTGLAARVNEYDYEFRCAEYEYEYENEYEWEYEWGISNGK
jgi:hypothetical protein